MYARLMATFTINIPHSWCRINLPYIRIRHGDVCKFLDVCRCFCRKFIDLDWRPYQTITNSSHFITRIQSELRELTRSLLAFECSQPSASWPTQGRKWRPDSGTFTQLFSKKNTQSTTKWCLMFWINVTKYQNILIHSTNNVTSLLPRDTPCKP